MYKAVKPNGDSIAVPQLLFSKLTAQGSDDARFRVALWLLGQGEGEAAQIASALRLPHKKVEAALHYWEGAGLIEQDAAQPEMPAPVKRHKMTTKEVVAAGARDETLGWLLDELQRAFGMVIGEGDINLFVTLYKQDGFSPDMILMAAAEAAANGAKKARYVEKVLFSWRAAGIHDAAAADKLLRLQAKRQQQAKTVARLMGLEGDPFTLADKKKIAVWFEEYGYGKEMIEAARLVAGDKRNDVKYLAGILKNWHAKAYRTPRDVQQNGEGQNLRSIREDAPPQQDVLRQTVDYVPMQKRGAP